ncbi:MAG: CRISPR-associated endonuclease Cas1 [Peptococcaceae bacterium]|nr:CRISPR-associated endonuclease Cas1 [Peptococcaceae bacterium]
MSTVYVCEQGAIIKKSGQRIVVARDRKVLLEIPVFKVKRVLLYGNVQLTSQAAALLLDSGVDVNFLTFGGRMRGRLTSTLSKNIFLRLAQYERWKDKAFKSSFAAAVVRGKLKNMHSFLLRFRRNHPEADFAAALAGIEKTLEQIKNKDLSVEDLFGLEGNCSRLYFEAFSIMVRGEMGFEGRNRRPPTDPVNSLLSLGYTVVSNELASVLEAMSFDPYLGFYHGLRYGRKSLALDLVEEFRQPLVDAFTLSIVNRRVFTADDFEKRPDGALYLAEEAFKKYFEQYEKRVGGKIEGENRTWRDIFDRQAKRLEKSVMDGVPYNPYHMKS